MTQRSRKKDRVEILPKNRGIVFFFPFRKRNCSPTLIFTTFFVSLSLSLLLRRPRSRLKAVYILCVLFTLFFFLLMTLFVYIYTPQAKIVAIRSYFKIDSRGYSELRIFYYY
uniref:Uncharacterized protein n=1 Tax=Cacopsylla melanoneura TaxID=428564 RepID=A0A8D8LE57_9HEMI